MVTISTGAPWARAMTALTCCMKCMLRARSNPPSTSLAEQLPVSRQAVAKHLAALERVGLTRVTPSGRERRYQVDEAQLARAVRFELKREEAWTIILFRHEGRREQVEFMHHCSTKWATFLMSLKSLVETGAGQPAPYDIKVSDWH